MKQSTLVIYVEPEQKQLIQKYAEQDGRSVSNFVNKIIQEYQAAHPLSETRKE